MLELNRKATRTALALAVLMTSFAFGQGARNGTAGASQLLIPVGARYLSGGGATARGSGIDALYWNPAGLARATSGIDAIFSRRTYIADIDINFTAVGVKLGRFGSLAFAARTFGIGNIDVTDEFNPDGTGEQFRPAFFTVGATYSKLLTDRTSLGFTANFVNEGFVAVDASGFAFDIGVQYYNFLDIPNLALGVVLKNFGSPMRYDGSALWIEAKAIGSDRQTEWYKVEAAAFDMPFIMDIGLSYRLNLGASSLDLGATFENNHFGQDEVRILGEYNLGTLASVRFGIVSATEVTDDPDTAEDESKLIESIFSGTSFGASLNLKQFTGVNLSIDYAIISTKFFDDNTIFALRLGI